MVVALDTLLPPSSSSRPPLPSPTAAAAVSSALAVLGPLPPTAPIHLAVAHLHLSDLTEFAPSLERGNPSTASADAATHKLSPRIAVDAGGAGRKIEQGTERVLVVTGSRGGVHAALEEDDEDWLRENGGRYDVLNRLARIDIRYCPSIKHVRLLLTLLSTSDNPSYPSIHLAQPPTMIILHDVAQMLLHDVEVDENAEPGVPPPTGREVRKDVCISDYLDIVSAARSAVHHSSSQRSTKAELMILEPSLGADDSLPVVHPDSETVAKAARERRVQIQHGLRWILGDESVCFVERAPESQEDGIDPRPAHTHTLRVGKETFAMNRVPCGGSEFASPTRPDGTRDEQRGWRWEWS